MASYAWGEGHCPVCVGIRAKRRLAVWWSANALRITEVTLNVVVIGGVLAAAFFLGKRCG